MRSRLELLPLPDDDEKSLQNLRGLRDRDVNLLQKRVEQQLRKEAVAFQMQSCGLFPAKRKQILPSPAQARVHPIALQQPLQMGLYLPIHRSETRELSAFHSSRLPR